MHAEIYQRSDDLWDWRIVADNGEIVATSGGQGYTERNDAWEGFRRVFVDVSRRGLEVRYV